MKGIAIVIMLMVGLLAVATDGSAQQDQIVNDKDIDVLHFEGMNYPPLARAGRVQGVVVVRVVLDNDGKVVGADAISGNGILIPATLANARTWIFRPNNQKSAVIVYNFTFAATGCVVYEKY